MVDSMLLSSECRKHENGLFVDSAKDAPFQRKIEFHIARKQFNPYMSASSDFHLETLNPNVDPQRSSSSTAADSSGKKSEGGTEPLEHGLDLDFSFGMTVRRIGAGLANLGNTCFLNSVLQCLTYTEPFAAYLQSGKHKSSCHTAGFCAMCAIQNHVKNALQSTGKILSPSHLVKNLRCISRNFRNSRQEDAHEYMVNLLESMHKCCLPYGVSSESPTAFEKSLVHKLFGGSLRSQVKCMQCSYSSNKFDPFLDLSLEIMKAESLRKALAHFTAVEQLDGGEKQYQCHRCNEKVQALKQLTVHKAPMILAIHLKRFGSHSPGHKIDKKIEFSPYLDLKPFVSDHHEGDYKYHLYGVLVHAGWSTHSGHYYCFVRTSSGMWYSLDDNRVVQVSEKRVLEQQAYMLFYARERRNPAPKKTTLDVACSGNLATSAAVNKSVFNFKEDIQNGQMERKVTVPALFNGLTSASLAQSMATVEISRNDSLTKEAVLQSNRHVIRESTTFRSPMVDKLLKDVPAKEPLLPYPTVKDTTPQHGSLKIDATQTSVCDGCLKPTLKNGGSVVNERGVIHCRCIGINCQKSNANGSLKCQNHSSTSKGSIQGRAEDHVQNGFSSGKEGDLTNRSCKKKAGADCKPQDIPSVECLKQPEDAVASVSDVVVVAGDAKRYHRPKKLPVVASLRVGPKQLFLASLSLRKKKKHKRSKRKISDFKDGCSKDLIEDLTSNDREASTSARRAQVTEQGCHISSKKRKKCRQAKHVKSRSGGSITIKEGGIREEGDLPGAVLASDASSAKRQEAVVKECDARAGDQEKRRSVEIGLMSMLMRGLQEATVAQWDDAEPVLSDMNGFEMPHKSSIGYVADEWDEEYDRGKRKKVRDSKTLFDGWNPFQEVAENRGLKKMRMAGHQPFRI
ncbi:ubiquitin carboxyl-terminal hydrolase 23-like [Aristolochia californica]|uniref:ubiquitin carboxyl-terminal hydrolase 23-like n=1 Tax=Aristolochia californica TaxID=171875 RepID=UPI0035D87684